MVMGWLRLPWQPPYTYRHANQVTGRHEAQRVRYVGRGSRSQGAGWHGFALANSATCPHRSSRTWCTPRPKRRHREIAGKVVDVDDHSMATLAALDIERLHTVLARVHPFDRYIRRTVERVPALKTLLRCRPMPALI
jgi:hypothetical protein